MQHTASDLPILLAADPDRVKLLGSVRDMCGPEFWIGAGFVRNLVWDALHGHPSSLADLTDIDVVHFNAAQPEAGWDRELEKRLRIAHHAPWSIKNQARMHIRNGHAPYRDLADALSHWPETATAIACRLGDGNSIHVLAPLGLADLCSGVVRPGPTYAASPSIILDRVRDKGWLQRWPRLRLDL